MMARKVLQLLVLLLCTFSLRAQFYLPLIQDTTFTSNHYVIETGTEYHANSLSNAFTQKFIVGGTLSNEQTQNTFDKQALINRFAVQSFNEFRCFLGAKKLGKDSLSWGVKAGIYGHANLFFSKDAFGLAFLGNENYIGNTANFSELSFHTSVFQKIGFGIFNKSNKSSLFLNVVNLQQYAKSYVRKGYLAQNEDASEIELKLQGELAFTSKNGLSNGIGFALDFDKRIPVQLMNEQKAIIQIQVQNLGLAFVNKGLTRYEMDSTYEYNGFQINQLIQANSLFGSNFSLMDSLKIQQRVTKSWVILPAFIQVAKLIDAASTKKVQTFYGIKLYPTFAAIPAGFFGVYWKLNPHYSIASSVSYSAFGKFRNGWYFTYNGKKVTSVLGSDDFLGFVSKKAFGQSLFLRFSWAI
uniref:hypothetical protein n=1 Tax=Fluviicola sp. TaxID=1917219 RepID=UPI00404A8FCB